jgi:lipoprotein-anchoring transpeptidase ErfK/SrfK
MAKRPSAAPTHRAVRPRYGRILSAAGSAGVTAVAALGAAGVLPSASGAERGGPSTGPTQGAMRLSDYAGPAETAGGPTESAAPRTEAPASPRTDAPTPSRSAVPTRRTEPSPAEEPAALPEKTGSGKRVVFDMSAQRVWLVDRHERVRRTYLVSGSLTDNLDPGTYAVYSTSRHAIGIDDSGTMEYMVRFAHGDRAAIGFHDIPVDDGRPVQSRAALGSPQSHGCIRQWRPDARALWEFAGVGSTVVVTA